MRCLSVGLPLLAILTVTLAACTTNNGAALGALTGQVSNDTGTFEAPDAGISGADSSTTKPDVGTTPTPDASVTSKCGNGVCDAGESAANCPADCKIAPPTCKTYADAQPILVSKCGACHNFGDSCQAIDQTTGAAITALSVMPSNMPPKNKPALTAAETALLNDWFSHGAPCDASGCQASGPLCGDGKCQAPESTATCPADCKVVGPICGDGTCDPGETAASCPGDCGAVLTQCGNGVCETGETAASCPADCNKVIAACGNGVCETGETAANCPADCGTTTGPVCGNGKCETGETAGNCPKDCSTVTTGNYCDTHCSTTQQPSGCYCDDQCSNYGDCCMADGSMPKTANKTCAGTCGLCNGGGTAPGPVCGDGTCSAGETATNCPADCGTTTPTCGNGKCDTGETATSCPADCGGTTTCKTTYSSVQTIFKNNCNGCHGHQFGTACNYASGKLSSIKSYVSTGSMPTNKSLSSSDKSAILKWISDGGNCTIAGCP